MCITRYHPAYVSLVHYCNESMLAAFAVMELSVQSECEQTTPFPGKPCYSQKIYFLVINADLFGSKFTLSSVGHKLSLVKKNTILALLGNIGRTVLIKIRVKVGLLTVN